MNDLLLQAQEVSITRDGRRLLDTVDLAVGAGEIITIIGPNGAGKTTLVRVLLGLMSPDQGRVTRRPGLRIGYMPQSLQLSAQMPLTVERFMALTGQRGSSLGRAAETAGIEHLLDRAMNRLSGGETQRVLLARALLRQPELLVLDEPVQGVDITGQQELYQLIANLREQLGCTVLMVSHDLHLVMAATDRVLCLNTHICCQGLPDEVSSHPSYLELFGRTTDNQLAVYTHHHDHRHSDSCGGDH